jgi:hypothetical protein
MQFLLNRYNKEPSAVAGVDFYRDPSSERTLRVDHSAGRAVLCGDAGEALLLRNQQGLWVPERNDWLALARVLGAPALARATHGF